MAELVLFSDKSSGGKDRPTISLLQNIRRRLTERQDIHLAGEVPILMQHDFGPYYLMERINFYISPYQPSYDERFLTDFVAGLFPDLKTDSTVDYKFQKFEFEQYGRPYWSLHFGKLLFLEEIGLLQLLTQASRYTSYDVESQQRWNIDTSIKGDIREQPVKRDIFIKIFPEGELADLVYRYYQFYHNPHRLNPILSMLGIDRVDREYLARTFDRLESKIDSYGYEHLHNGRLNKDLETFLERHSTSESD